MCILYTLELCCLTLKQRWHSNHFPPLVPDPPTNTQVSPVDPTGLRVSWTPPPDDGLEGFRISYTPMSDCPGILGGSMEVDGGGVREGMVGLVGATEYSVTVSARNDMGYGPPSAGVLETTAEAG